MKYIDQDVSQEVWKSRHWSTCEFSTISEDIYQQISIELEHTTILLTVFRSFLETDSSQTTERVHSNDLISARTFARDDQKNDKKTWMKKIREFYSRLQNYVQHRDDFQWYQSSSESNQIDLKWKYYDERFDEWNAAQKRSTISDRDASSSFDHFKCEH